MQEAHVPSERRFYCISKRTFDIIASAIGLILVSPLLVVLYTVVKLDSPGPFFFRQVRMGRFGKSFHIFKIRTMVTGAQQMADSSGGITSHKDRRITRIGRFLRKSRIDELPQLFNVFRGDMSLVGPRPEVSEYQTVNPELWKIILSVRPGITDTTALEYINEETLLRNVESAEELYRTQILPKKQQLYLEYIKNRTFRGDVGIIVKTILSLTKQQKIKY